jgi:ferrous iron transport protein A
MESVKVMNSVAVDMVASKMPLVFVPYKKEVEIVEIRVDDNIKKRFCSLGLLVGAKITSLSNEGDCVILKLKDTKLALNKSLAMKIIVI